MQAILDSTFKFASNTLHLLLVPLHKPAKQDMHIEHEVKVCSKITGLPVRALSLNCKQRTLRTACRILQDPSGPLPR